MTDSTPRYVAEMGDSSDRVWDRTAGDYRAVLPGTATAFADVLNRLDVLEAEIRTLHAPSAQREAPC